MSRISASRGRRARFVSQLVLLAISTIALAPLARSAAPVVYHSPADDGVMPGAAVEIPADIQSTLHLYIDGGSQPSPSDPCHLGSGDEVCAWDLVVSGEAGLSLVSFTGAGDVVFDISGTTLRCNGGDPIKGTLGAAKLGDLVVRGGTSGSLQLLPSRSVNAALEVDMLPPATLVTVPEPGFLPVPALGLLLLLACLRRRDRRRQTPLIW